MKISQVLQSLSITETVLYQKNNITQETQYKIIILSVITFIATGMPMVICNE